MVNRRICKKCNVEKEFSQFNKSKGCKHGISHECKKCQAIRRRTYGYRSRNPVKQKQLKWYQIYKDFKICKGCSCCGMQEPVCLQFHHVGPKAFNINYMASTANQYDELLKCAIVCANCHYKIHAGLIPQPKTLTKKDIDTIAEVWNSLTTSSSA